MNVQAALTADPPGPRTGSKTGLVFSPLRTPSPSGSPLVYSVYDWVINFLSQPHPALGRKGDVCPYTAGSVRSCKFWIAEVDHTSLTVATAQVLIEDALEVFESIAAHESTDRKLVTTVIVMPHVTTFDAIDTVQKSMKSLFVSKGLMLGQFYPGCNEPGLWNSDFRPLDAPYPMLAIRHMVPSDFPFLVNDVEWTKAYLKRFAPELPSKARNLAAEALGLWASAGDGARA